MADKLGLGDEIRELKIGQSFTNPKSKAFHTLKYDFKPASVDTSKKANVEVPGVNQVTVTVPHLDGADIPQTVFKGSQKPYTKECVLIIDRVTGEITIEKLNCNIQVKKTYEYTKPKASKADKLNQSKNRSGSTSSKGLPLRSQTPPALVGHRVSNKTKVTSGSRRADRQITQLVPKHHSPLQASPTYLSPGHHAKSPRRDFHNTSANESQNQSTFASMPMLGVDDSPPNAHSNMRNPHFRSHNQSTLASLPMIGIDDFSDPRPASRGAAQNPRPPPPLPQQQQQPRPTPTAADKWPKTSDDVGEMSDTSSGSSDSDSDDSDDPSAAGGKKQQQSQKANGFGGSGNAAASGGGPVRIDTLLLNDDLHLSESGSDSE